MKTIKLIEGQYSPEEASEMLLEIIGRKVNFHKLKNLSSEVRFGRPDPESDKRIEELQQAKEQVVALMQLASEINMRLSIESSIRFTLVEAEPVQEEVLKNREMRVGAC